ncbi:MAG: glycoside hydrolase family 127 protein [Streptosporangiales bacterium]|nr:glycoside hydrolase family 127 protein [Streptosporangiales bacterium]
MTHGDERGPVSRAGTAGVPDWAHHPAEPGARLGAGLLGDWQRRNAEASLPLALTQLEDAGNLDNVRLAIRADGGAPGTDGYRGPVFMDSDIYKTLEAIGWELGRSPGNPALTAFTGDVIELLRQAQRSDGYLNSWFQATGESRYSRLASSHEMYCAGHLIQAALALHRGAGDDRLLDIAARVADHLVREFAGQARALDGHPVIETALAELHRETGTPAYLDLARQFTDQRGSGLAGDFGMGSRYLQDHQPVRQTDTEVGHAVRALYLEAGIADVAAETGDRELLQSSIRRWDDMVAAKTYLTGGNGSRHNDEAFGDRFELPPDRAYTETCAAIASFQWSWRLLLATGDPKYADHMERVLYNGFAASLSTDGKKFFYVNPLQRREDHYEKDDPGRRHAWFSCACCPPNIMRLLASLHHYLATTAGDTLYLQQFAGATVSGAGLTAEVTTDYPWDGRVTVRITAAEPGERALAVRVPAWAAGSKYQLNHDDQRTVPAPPAYLLLRREWKPGDTLTLDLDVAPRWTLPDRRVDAVRGCAAIERGPLVYCFEQADQAPGAAVDDLLVTPGSALAEREADLRGVGPTVQVAATAGNAARGQPVTATAIPYFQWDNRDRGAMRVWMVAGSPA